MPLSGFIDGQFRYKKRLTSIGEITFTTITRVDVHDYCESGLNLPPAEMLIKLADALATTIDYLLTGNPVEDTPLANNRLFKRFRAVEHFDDDDQEAIIK